MKPLSYQERILHARDIANTLFDGTMNLINEVVLSIIDNESYYLKDMLKQKDKSDFIKAMEHKIDIHERRNHWEICRRNEIPEGMKSIMSMWAFKRKRLPDGTLVKHKARTCAHGGQQQWGINYWETYAPVVN